MGILANLGVKLSLNSAEFKAGLDDATKNLLKFEQNQKKSLNNAKRASAELASTMGTVAVGAGLLSAALLGVFKKADEISDMADAFDASIGSIIGMGKALDLAGGKSENLGNSLAKLSSNIENAREGNDKLRDSFKSIGISTKELANLNPDEMFNRVAEQLSKIEDPAKRSAKAVELLGKAAKGIDWKQYVEEYKKVADPDLEAAIRESAKAWDNIQKGIKATFELVVKIIQPLAAMVNHFATLGKQYDKFKEEGGTINWDTENPMGADGIEYKGEGKPKAKETSAPAKKMDKDLGLSDREKGWLKERAALEENFKIKIKEIEATAIKIQRETELIGLTEKESELAKAKWAIEDENAKLQLDLEKQIQVEKAKGEEQDKVKIELLKSQKALYAEMAEVQIDASRREMQSKENKIRQQQVLTNSERETFNTAIGNMEVLAQKNKAGFQAWKAMSIAMAVIDGYTNTQKAYQRGLEIPYVGFILGPVFAATAFAASMARVQAIRSTQYQGRQKGGSMVANTPYLVGEAGPELVIPHKGGTVIPNNQLSSHMGNGGVTYNGPYIASLNAIDTQSGMEFINRNKEAIWAANLTAQRSVPSLR